MSNLNDDTTWNRMPGEHQQPLAPDYEDYGDEVKSTEQKQLEREVQLKQAKQSTISSIRNKQDDRMGKGLEGEHERPHSNKVRHFR
ncbi:hypothetical protein AAVH_28337 [Aphelenchoides avenae]|nr:hypothetical protein AAVH_28337 [Aphelenchus avenae]